MHGEFDEADFVDGVGMRQPVCAVGVVDAAEFDGVGEVLGEEGGSHVTVNEI